MYCQSQSAKSDDTGFLCPRHVRSSPSRFQVRNPCPAPDRTRPRTKGMSNRGRTPRMRRRRPSSGRIVAAAKTSGVSGLPRSLEKLKGPYDSAPSPARVPSSCINAAMPPAQTNERVFHRLFVRSRRSDVRSQGRISCVPGGAT